MEKDGEEKLFDTTLSCKYDWWCIWFI